MKSSNKPHIIVVGAGLSGLAASLEIERLGGSVTILERTESLGGRIKTDRLNGFLLDHGFQVLLTSYPELKQLKISDSMNLKAFLSGAICHRKHSTYRVINPLRHFFRFLKNSHNISFETYLDFLKLASIIYSKVPLKYSTDKLLKKKNISFDTKHYFLEPFFGGVFLDTQLDARAQIFVEYLRLFLYGFATLPEQGMQALPRAIYNKLKNTRILFHQEVKEVGEGSVLLADGDQISGDAVIVAVDNPAYKALVKGSWAIESKSVRCFYFSAPKGHIKNSPFLHVGNGGPISNLCIPNHIQPSYAPKGFDLISATVVSQDWQEKNDLQKVVGENVSSWLSIPKDILSLVKSYYIKHALPFQKTPPMLDNEVKMKGFETVFLAGEIVQPPSINGALVSGRKAGKAALLAVKRPL